MKRAALFVFAVFLLIGSCDFFPDSGAPAGKGNLIISIGNNSRAAFPAGFTDTFYYEFKLSGPDEQELNFSLAPGRETLSVQVRSGEWRIEAAAYTPDDTLAGTGSVTRQIGGGSSQVRIPMTASSFHIEADVTTIAGDGTAGFADGMGTAAQFDQPNGLAFDSEGNLYVADNNNQRIRIISPQGLVSTFAGTGTSGSNDGPGATATFSNPQDIAVDSAGNVFVAEIFSRIRKISPDGTVSTIAGSLGSGYADGPGATAKFNSPVGITIDREGSLYVADANGHRIRKLTTDGVTWNVSTAAGDGTAAHLDGPVGSAQFFSLRGLAAGEGDSLYITDSNRIRKISGGMVSTLAGAYSAGSADGPGAVAQFYYPAYTAIDSGGSLYIGDTQNYSIRKMTPELIVSTIAGDGTAGFADGPAAAAQFDQPAGVAIDAQGNIYVSEILGCRIRKITFTVVFD
jgi:sugar lactone lactonase YvrE